MGYELSLRLPQAEDLELGRSRLDLAARALGTLRRLLTTTDEPAFDVVDDGTSLVVTLSRSAVVWVGPHVQRVADEHDLELWDPQARDTTAPGDAVDWGQRHEASVAILATLREVIESASEAPDTMSRAQVMARVRERLGADEPEDPPATVVPPFPVSRFILPIEVLAPTERDWQQIARAARSKDVVSRRVASNALGGWRGEQRAVAILVELLRRDEDAYVRGNAAQSLGLLGAEEAYSEVLTAWRELRAHPAAWRQVPEGAKYEPATSAAFGAVALARLLGVSMDELRRELETLQGLLSGPDLERVDSLLRAC